MPISGERSGVGLRQLFKINNGKYNQRMLLLQIVLMIRI